MEKHTLKSMTDFILKNTKSQEELDLLTTPQKHYEIYNAYDRIRNYAEFIKNP